LPTSKPASDFKTSNESLVAVHLDYLPPTTLLTAADKADQRSLTPSDGTTAIAFLYLSGPLPA
jgi:hypothetical protein